MRGQTTLAQAAQRELDIAVSRSEPGNLNINNIQVAVWHRGAVAFAGVGNRVRQGLDDPPFVTTETLFRLASVSKPITAVGTLWQVERGGFELGRSFNGYLSELPEALHQIQARNILTHTSGIRHYGTKKSPTTPPGSNEPPVKP